MRKKVLLFTSAMLFAALQAGAQQIVEGWINVADKPKITYNGAPQEPAVTVNDPGDEGSGRKAKTLKEGVDYVLTYQNNINAGDETPTVYVTGKGTYTGSVNKTFAIARAAYTYTIAETQTIGKNTSLKNIKAPTYGTGVAGETVKGTLTWYADNEGERGSAVSEKNSPAFKTEEETLTLHWIFKPGDDNYLAGSKTGKVTFTIKGLGQQPLSFKAGDEGVESGSTYEKTFGDADFVLTLVNSATAGSTDIDLKTLTISDTSVADTVITRNGDEVTSVSIKIKKTGSTTISATVPAIEGEYVATTASFVLTVAPKSLSEAIVTVNGTYTYNGTLQTPEADNVVVKLDGKTLVNDTDYTYKVAGVEGKKTGTDAGTGANAPAITVTAKGNYTGEATGTYTIAKASAPAYASGKGSVTVYVQENEQKDYEFNLAGLPLPALPAGTSFGTLGYRLVGDNFVTLSDDNVKIFGDEGTPSITQGVIKLPVVEGIKAGNTASIIITVTSTNYNNFTATLRLTTADKKQVSIELDEKSLKSVYDGKPYNYGTPKVTDIFGEDKVTHKGIGFDVIYYKSGKSLEGAPKDAGKYTMTLSVPAANDTIFGSQTFDFEITKRPVQIVADEKSIIVGDPVPALTYHLAGALEGEAAIKGTPVLSTTATSESAAGLYDIIIDPALTGVETTSNYTLGVPATVSAVLSINAAPVLVIGVRMSISAKEMSVGESFRLTATVLPMDATTKEVEWSTSNPEVATVSDNGEITAIALGTATITVTTIDGAYTATCSVTVNDNGVGIEEVTQDDVKVFFSQSALFVDSPSDETVWVYSFTGRLLFRDKKAKGQAVFTTANSINKGLVIVRGSSGWAKKAIVR